MPDKHANEQTLYDVLAETAPATARDGDTIFTATKETVDNDREETRDALFLEER